MLAKPDKPALPRLAPGMFINNAGITGGSICPRTPSTPPPTPGRHHWPAQQLPGFLAKLAGRLKWVWCLSLPTGCAVMWETQFVEGGKRYEQHGNPSL